MYQKVDQSRQTVLQLVIHALAGNGKTELVRRFVQENSKDFDDNVLWIKAESEAALTTSFIEIAELLNLDIKESDGSYKSINYIIVNVYNYLRDLKVLFVFDDALDLDVLKKFLPTFRASTVIIITSQKSDWPNPDFEKLHVQLFSEDESNKLLANQCQSNLTDQQIQEIITVVEGHPLTLQQFITALNCSSLSANELITIFREEKAHLLQRKVSSLPQGVTTIAGVRINVKQCSEKGEDGKLAVEILKRLCLLEVEQIPMSVVEILTSGESKLDIDSALCQLESMSLITKRGTDHGRHIITIHSIVQATISEMMEEEKADYTFQCLKFFFQEIDREKESFSIYHTDFGKTYFHHLLKIMQSKNGDERLGRTVAEKIKDIENIMQAKADYEGISQITDILLKNYTLENETQLTVQKVGAASLFKQGKYKTARQNYEKILSKELETIGSKHQNTLSTNHRIAFCYLRQGKYDIAKSHLERNLSMQNDVLGPLHEETLTTLHYLAFCHQEKKEIDKALAIYGVVLNNRKQTISELHPDTLRTQHNMAGCHYDKENYDYALVLFQEVLDKRKQTMGDVHPETLRTQHSIACCYLNKQNYDYALVLFQEVLGKEIQTMGEMHPDTLRTQHSIALCYHHKQNYDYALKLYHEVLDKRIKTIGDMHPNTLGTINDMANIYGSMGNNVKAFKTHEEVLKKCIEVLGQDHPMTGASRRSLSFFRDMINEQDENDTVP